ncbi:hypothetical protein EYF80_037720 [Liparis tanakae]|uniref:Uncharacterized protein n=1 Tax=Liparis tanakae TaxID=230148 RepID=A0A4Z2GFJ7_9TELE|nr:hypothetical protein EYF80_037720 [Liparis tanakae]
MNPAQWEEQGGQEETGGTNGMTEVIRQISLTPTLSFLSCRAYGKQGMTAETLDAEAILQALIMISSSIKLSLISPQPLCTM